MNHKELHTGVNGSGNTVYLVVTVNAQGQWVWIERFDSKAEAESWLKYA